MVEDESRCPGYGDDGDCGFDMFLLSAHCSGRPACTGDPYNYKECNNYVMNGGGDGGREER